MDLDVSYWFFNTEVTAPKLPTASQKSVIKILDKVSMLNICHIFLIVLGLLLYTNIYIQVQECTYVHKSIQRFTNYI